MAENQAVLTARSALRSIPVVTNEAEHDAVLAEIAALMDREPAAASADGFRLRLLARISEEYEEEHWPIEPLSPPEMIAFAMEQQGRTRADLVAILGSSSRVSDVLNARRALTVAQIRDLAAFLRLPAEVLVRPYRLKPAIPAASTKGQRTEVAERERSGKKKNKSKT